MTQVLSSLENSEAARDYARATERAKKDGRLRLPRTRGGAGFRPVLTTLPEGTNMTATAVISADRRYVRVTPTPLFSVIGPVSTFNFSTGGSSTTMGTMMGMMGTASSS